MIVILKLYHPSISVHIIQVPVYITVFEQAMIYFLFLILTKNSNWLGLIWIWLICTYNLRYLSLIMLGVSCSWDWHCDSNSWIPLNCSQKYFCDTPKICLLSFFFINHHLSRFWVFGVECICHILCRILIYRQDDKWLEAAISQGVAFCHLQFKPWNPNTVEVRGGNSLSKDESSLTWLKERSEFVIHCIDALQAVSNMFAICF